MPPRPDASSAPEPWSDADFLPVEAILRAAPRRYAVEPAARPDPLAAPGAAPGAGHPQLRLVP